MGVCCLDIIALVGIFKTRPGGSKKKKNSEKTKTSGVVFYTTILKSWRDKRLQNDQPKEKPQRNDW